MSKDDRFYCFDDDILNYSLENKKEINGGQGSGNFNPGQGRGVGKPSNKSKKLTYEEYTEKFRHLTRSEKEELDKEYPEYADKYFKDLVNRDIERRKKEREEKELEEKFKSYEKDNSHPHFDLNKISSDFKFALDISPSKGLKVYHEGLLQFIELPNKKEYYNKVKGVLVRVFSMKPRDYMHTIIENNNGHYTSMKSIEDRTSDGGIQMYVDKYKNGEKQDIPFIKFDKNGKFSGEQEGFHRAFAADEVGDKEIPVVIVSDYYGEQPNLKYGRDITESVEKYFLKNNDNSLTRNQRLDAILNGGQGSGNFNPGQGRGVGKPNNGSSKLISTMNYDGMIEDGSENWRDVAFDLSVQALNEIEKNHPELIDKEKQEKNLKNYYEEEYKRWEDRKSEDDRIHNLSYDEYKEKLISKEIDYTGSKLDEYHPMYTLPLYGAGASPFLEGLTMFAMGANIYFTKRKEFDERHKISETIDKNKDLWTSYDKPLYRGVSTNQEGLDRLKKGETISMNGLSSWSSKKEVGDRFTKTALFKTGNIPVVFIDKTKKHDKTLFYPFSSAMGFNSQYEYVQSGSNKYKIIDVYKEGDVYYAEIESY